MTGIKPTPPESQGPAFALANYAKGAVESYTRSIISKTQLSIHANKPVAEQMLAWFFQACQAVDRYSSPLLVLFFEDFAPARV